MTATAAAPQPLEDVELARRIGARDERAFETVMRAHNRKLYRVARSILRDDAEAEDAVQEAYFSAYRNIFRKLRFAAPAVSSGSRRADTIRMTIVPVPGVRLTITR